MSDLSQTIKYAPFSYIDSASFTGDYMPLGNPTLKGSRIFKIVNLSNVDVYISTDGITDHDIVPADTSIVYYIGTNKSSGVPSLELPPTQFFAAGEAGEGLVYVVTLYA